MKKQAYETLITLSILLIIFSSVLLSFFKNIQLSPDIKIQIGEDAVIINNTNELINEYKVEDKYSGLYCTNYDHVMSICMNLFPDASLECSQKIIQEKSIPNCYDIKNLKLYAQYSFVFFLLDKNINIILSIVIIFFMLFIFILSLKLAKKKKIGVNPFRTWGGVIGAFLFAGIGLIIFFTKINIAFYILTLPAIILSYIIAYFTSYLYLQIYVFIIPIWGFIAGWTLNLYFKIAKKK